MNMRKFIAQVNEIMTEDNIAVEYLAATNEHIDDVVGDLYHIFVRKRIPNDDVPILLNKMISTAISSQTSILDVADKFDINAECGDTINRYFDEVGKIYNHIDECDDVEYCRENRDILIKSNLKTVIYIAKMYRNKGVEFTDLISAGNLGLCIAFDKFKPNEIKIRRDLISILDDMDTRGYTVEVIDDRRYYKSSDILEAFSSVIHYGKLNTLLHSFSKHKDVYEYDEIVDFINTQVCGARFNSVATMWIRAMILSEIKNASLVRRPDSVRDKSKKMHGVYNPDTYISLSKKIGDENNTTIESILDTADNVDDPMQQSDRQFQIRSVLDKLLQNVSTRDKRIFLKKFGVGLPRPLQTKEIAQQEDLSIARVSQIFQQVMTTIHENAEREGIDESTISAILD